MAKQKRKQNKTKRKQREKYNKKKTSPEGRFNERQTNKQTSAFVEGVCVC